MIRKCVALAALGLLALPSLGLAEPTGGREAISIKVSTDGLDLDTPDGLAKLRDRTSQAIASACSSGERLNTGLSPDWQCRNEMGYDASMKMSALGESAKGRVASR